MEIIYRANDGREFDDEEACELYEKMKAMPRELMGFKLYDAGGDEVPLFDEECRVDDDFYYIVTHSAEEASTLYDVLHDYGISSPWDSRGWADGNPFEAGCYYYDCDDSRWKNFKDFEDTYNHMLSIFNQGK